MKERRKGRHERGKGKRRNLFKAFAIKKNLYTIYCNKSNKFNLILLLYNPICKPP